LIDVLVVHTGSYRGLLDPSPSTGSFKARPVSRSFERFAPSRATT
jgi:hypothetical protein